MGGLEHYTGFGIDKKYEKIHQYITEVQKRQSVNGLIQPKEAYVTALGKFFIWNFETIIVVKLFIFGIPLVSKFQTYETIIRNKINKINFKHT